MRDADLSREHPSGDSPNPIAHRLGSAVGFLRRLWSHEDPEPPRRPEKAEGRRRRQRASPRTARAAAGEFETLRRRLTAELDRLEREQRRQHELITSGADRPSQFEIDSRIRASRRLSARITAVREDLARIERHIARERRLRALERDPEPGHGAPRSSRAPSARSTGRSPARRDELGGRAAKGRRIVEGMSFRDRSQRVAILRLAERLFDADDAVRRETAVLLGKRRTKASLELLQLAVDDPDRRVRLAALNALVGFEQPSAIEVFRRRLRDDDALVRLTALRGLGSLDAELSPAELVAAVEDTDTSVRVAAIGMLAWRRDVGTTEVLWLALHDAEPAVRAAAAECLGARRDERAVLPLARLLDDAQESVQTAAEEALRSLLGSEFDRVADGPSRAEAIKTWWRQARVERALSGDTGPEISTADSPLQEDDGKFETIAPEPAVAAKPKPVAAPPAAEEVAESDTVDVMAGLVDDGGDDEAPDAAEAAAAAGESKGKGAEESKPDDQTDEAQKGDQEEEGYEDIF